MPFFPLIVVLDVLYFEDGALYVLGLLPIGVVVMLDHCQLVLKG